MPRISQESIRRVREANDAVEVVGRYVNLRRAGSAYKGLCPFHKENTPSFTVSPQRQSFKCFGCGVGGSVVDFTMQIERLDFVEAIERLAEQAGVELEYEQYDGVQRAAPSQGRSKSLLFRVMEWGQKRYHATLTKSDIGAQAREYLASRGMSQELIESWGLGFAPESFDAVLNSGMTEFGDATLLDTVGLTRTNDSGKRYDFFRNRLLFPISDASGRVVAFGGRKMNPDDPGGKYINSPATPIYEKSRVLYGIDRLALSQFNRTHSKGKRLVVVVEGYFDVIACHAAGIDCAVAPCGTSITPEQIQTLRRFGDRIVLVMDGDAAGQASMERIAGEVVALGADVVAVSLPEGQDPDDYLKNHTAEDFLRLVEQGRDLFRFKLDSLASRYDLTRVGSRLDAAEEALSVISMATNEVLKDLLVRQTAEFFDVDEAAIRGRLRKTKAAIPNDQSQVPLGKIEVPAAERTLLLRLLTHPELVAPLGEFLAYEDFESVEAAGVYRAILNCYDELGGLRFPDVYDFVEADQPAVRSLLGDLLEGDLSLKSFETKDGDEAFELDQTVEAIKRWHMRRRGERRAIPDGDPGLKSELEQMRSRKKGRSRPDSARA